MRLFLRQLLFATGWGIAALGPTTAVAAEPVEFDRQIRPILSDKCFHCHGPDAETREADLRLDTPQGLLESVVLPGAPEESELIRRIFSEDDDERMPPPETGLSLSADERERLRQWVLAGATMTAHWAFENLPRQTPLPELADPTLAAWAKRGIDRFVAARLASEGLLPSPAADPLRWLRRSSFDLTGLPPEARDIERFETELARQGAEAAYSAAVDRFLASTAYGEHMAIGWFDAARYADSYGYQSDQLNSQWPWRDWVVRALNANMPYDRFLTLQLAGDLVKTADRREAQDNQLATAFNRLHRMTNEGGSIPEEWLLENAADRTNVFGTAVLGLTLECARCHDHKYDPITQRDYFSILAFFNAIDENGLYDHASKVPAPSLLLSNDEQQAEYDKLVAAREAAESAATRATRSPLDERYQAWRSTRESAFQAPAAGFRDCAGRFEFEGDLQKLRNLADPAQAAIEATGVAPCAGRRGQGIEFDGDSGIEFPGLLAVDHWDPWTLDLWLRDAVQDERPVVLAHRTFGTDVGYNGMDVMLEGGRVAVRIYRVWPGNGFGVQTKLPLLRDQWQHLAVTYDGSCGAEGIKIYVAGRPVEVHVLRDRRIVKSAATKAHGAGHFALGARLRDRGFRGGRIDDLTVSRRALAPLEIAELHDRGSIAAAIASGAHEKRLREYYVAAVDESLRTAREELRTARRAQAEFEEGLQEVAVMAEFIDPQTRQRRVPRTTHVLLRGAYDAPKTAANQVDPDGFQQILPPMPAPRQGESRTRADLADWVADPDHPLTARVFVNRLWANFFGRGLVATPENFGSQGAAPTHPELLDWLARDFVDHGWDVKRLCRQIVLSATYRQDSRADAALRQRDPENLLLARGPGFRLSGEQLRDQALAASGLLVRDLGGAPVSPYQPGEDLWREANAMSPPYQQSVGQALHRRSLYSVWKRTAPLPNMIAFDATTREVCTMSRSRTNTPLQALVLLNDVQFVEAARALAVRVMRQGTGTATDDAAAERRLAKAFLLTTGRPPEERELTLLRELYDEQLAIFTAAPAEDVAGLLKLGEFAPDVPPSPALAAMTVACQAILNLDATIMRR
ncbi:MAG: DUF1553 domain-containing protein [Pirellulales bacterium]|nr:DUF1553 domain-containing protein [Pirellulales bacterium]